MQYSEHEEKLINEAVERALRLLPNVVSNVIKQTGTLKSLSQKFYSENKDLAGCKELVAKVMEKEEAENPGVSYDRLLQNVGPKVRQIQSCGGFNVAEIKKPSLQGLDDSLNGVL